MAKARTRRRATQMTIPVAVLAGLIPGLTRPAQELFAGDFAQAANFLQYNFVPWNPWDKKVSFYGVKQTYPPLLAGVLVHKMIGGRLGVNRMLANAGVPLLRL